MFESPDLPLQKAIFEKLSSDAALMARIEGVFDHVPKGKDFPYVTVGENSLSPWGTHTFDGANVIVTIHTWTRGSTRKVCKQIMADIYRILHRETLAVAGFSTTEIHQEFGESMLDPDGQTYHGIQRFRILLGGN
jgi:hypothetical protein